MTTNTSDRFSMLYRDFYIEVDNNSYMATSYAPRHIIRAKDIDQLRRKVDDYLENRD